MKKLFLFITLILITSCEKVIDLDLSFNDETYVIDAKINKHVNSTSATSEVLITKSRPYFEDNLKYINDASVKIVELSTNKEYFLNFVSDGLYKIDIPKIDEQSEFRLLVEHQNNKFNSVERLTKSNLIDNVVQGDRDSFSGDDIEIITTFTDSSQLDNYFLFEFGEKGNLQVARDLYINGNSFTFSYFINKDQIPNSKKLRVKMEGINYYYFKYMLQILIQTNTQNGPFSTPPATIKGNIINQNNNSNDVFGYFKVCEYDEYILEDIIID